MSYLIMMSVRMLEMKRVLRPTGSIYLHVDPTASHYLKTMMGGLRDHLEADWQQVCLPRSSRTLIMVAMQAG